MLLVFNAEATLAGGMLLAHGSCGLGHFALGVTAAWLEVWQKHLLTCGVAVEKKAIWSLVRRSI